MKNRRTFLGMAAASLLPLGLDAQTAPTTSSGPAAPRPNAELARHALTGPFEGYEAVLIEVGVRAGSLSPRPHRHTGFVVGYVLDGEVRFAIDNQAERLVPPGGTFFEPIGAVHSTSGATAGAPARFLAFLVVPEGSDVVAPA